MADDWDRRSRDYGSDETLTTEHLTIPLQGPKPFQKFTFRLKPDSPFEPCLVEFSLRFGYARTRCYFLVGGQVLTPTHTPQNLPWVSGNVVGSYWLMCPEMVMLNLTTEELSQEFDRRRSITMSLEVTSPFQRLVPP